MSEKQDKSETQSIGAVISSVFSAFLGVQSAKKHKEDFTKGRPHQYIIVGLIGTALFIGILVLIVKLVIGLAAK